MGARLNSNYSSESNVPMVALEQVLLLLGSEGIGKLMNHLLFLIIVLAAEFFTIKIVLPRILPHGRNFEHFLPRKPLMG